MQSYIQCLIDLAKTLALSGGGEFLFAMLCGTFSTIRYRVIWQTIAAWGALKFVLSIGLAALAVAIDLIVS